MLLGFCKGKKGAATFSLGGAVGAKTGEQEVGMSTFRKESVRLGEGMGPGRPAWRLDFRDVLGVIENFLHGEKLACLTVSRISML